MQKEEGGCSYQILSMCVSMQVCKAKPCYISHKLLLLFLYAKQVLFRDCETIHMLENDLGFFWLLGKPLDLVLQREGLKNPAFQFSTEHGQWAQSYSVCDELRQQSLSQADCSQGITESVLGWIWRNALCICMYDEHLKGDCVETKNNS